MLSSNKNPMPSFHECRIYINKYLKISVIWYILRNMTGVKKKPKQEMSVIDGKLCMTTCLNCSKRNLSVAYFAPTPSNQNIKKFADFIQACDIGDVEMIKGLVSTRCKYCRETNSASKRQVTGNGMASVKNRMLQKIKEDMQEKGCAICGCFDIERLECDHPDRKNKVGKVLDPHKWNGNTSAEDLWNEYQKCQVLCSSCHSMQPSHNAFRGADSSQIEAKSSYSEEYSKKVHREYKEKMQAYNRKRKRDIGSCAMCQMEVVEGNETGFQWAHNDERDKVACVSKLCENAYNEKNIQKIDDEISKCQLLCSGCHKVFQTQVRFKKSFEEWDALIARGVNATR
jgi:hypothetical protein